MRKIVNIENKQIGDNCLTFVIAEAASNHMCDLDLAKKMISEAAAAGADAIKFQTYKADRLVTSLAESYWKYPGGTSQLDYYKQLDKFDEKEYSILFEYAKDRGIIAFSTPFDIKSASMLNDLGAPLFKIASCDLIDVRLLRHVAKFGKPIILSTGGSTLNEVHSAVEILANQGVEDLILMACTLSYPCENESAHLNRIQTFQKEFPDITIGVSDHTRPDPHMVIPSVAVALGAKVVEKHYTLDRSMTGSGHAFSMEPNDLAKIIENIRITEQVLGSSNIDVYPVEETARHSARRSLVAEVSIKCGEILSSEMIGIKRPGTGLPASMIDQIVGKRTRQNIGVDEQLSLEMLEDDDL